MPDLTTASVVVDFIRYKLSSNGLECPQFGSLEENHQDSTNLPMSLQTVVRKLTHEVEHRFRKESNGTTMTDGLHVTPSTASAVFHSVIYEIFLSGGDGGQNRSSVRPSWGRICSLLAFSGAMAVHCVQNEMPQMVDQVANWTISYIDTNLLGWINSNGGWIGLVPPPDPPHDPWLYRVMLGVAALGAVTALAVILVR